MTQPKPIIQDFETLFDAESGEQAAQDFIERNTELFYPPHELNHGVHLDLLISKFRIDTSLVTDFAYLTKSSGVWWLVFVELEDPAKQLFTKNAVPTAELTAAIQQVNTWRTFVKKNAAEVFRRIAPLKKPLQWNKLLFRYALVIGRTGEFRADQKKVDAFEELGRDDFRVLTYDSLISAYKNKPNPRLNVIVQTREKFAFKYRHSEDTDLFTWLSPNDFELTADEGAHYKAHGYDIDAWSRGKQLVVDRKQTDDKFMASVDTAFAAAQALSNKDFGAQSPPPSKPT